MSTILSLVTKKLLIFLGGIIVFGIIVSLLLTGGNSKAKTLVVHPGEFLEQVSLSGKVVASENLDLSFERVGKVRSVMVEAGSEVGAGMVLVTLDDSELRAELGKAEAILESAKSDLIKAEGVPQDARENLIDKIKDSYTKADDAVRSKADQVFINPQTSSVELALVVSDAQLVNRVIHKRLEIESKIFPNWKTSLDILSSASNFETQVRETKNNLDSVRSFLDDLALIINNPNTLRRIIGGATEVVPDSWRADISTARTNVNVAASNVTAAKEKLNDAESDISSLRSKLNEAIANIDYYRAQLEKAVLRAPISGIVARQDARVGSVVGVNESIISLLSVNTLQIESYVPEKNIPFIKMGDGALVTLDAYGEDTTFEARVISIDPAETIRDGVSTYKIKLQFIKNDFRIKSGMTANVLVTTNKKSNVISVPQGIVITKGNERFVKVMEKDVVQERKIQVGSVSSLGQIEVISGLIDGDVVVLELSK